MTSNLSELSLTATRIVGALLAVGFVLIFVLSVIALSASAHSYRVINSITNGQYGCALSAEYSGITSDGNSNFYLKDGPCEFAIAGEVVIAVYAIAVAVFVVIRLIAKCSLFSVFVTVELVLAVLMTLLSLCVSMTLSIGLAITCREFREANGQYSCVHFYFGTNDSIEYFYNDQVAAQVTAWLGFAVLLCIDAVYIVINIMWNRQLQHSLPPFG